MSTFFFHLTAATEIYTLSLHDALPISADGSGLDTRPGRRSVKQVGGLAGDHGILARFDPQDGNGGPRSADHGIVSDVRGDKRGDPQRGESPDDGRPHGR